MEKKISFVLALLIGVFMVALVSSNLEATQIQTADESLIVVAADDDNSDDETSSDEESADEESTDGEGEDSGEGDGEEEAPQE